MSNSMPDATRESGRRPSRRAILGGMAALAATSTVPLFGAASAVQAAAGPASDLLYLSTWGGTSIYGFRFDPAAGSLTSLGAVAAVRSNWASAHPAKPVLYVGSGEDGGVVSSYRVDLASGALQLGTSVRTDAGGTAGGGISYLEVDAGALLVANFEAGLAASLPLQDDGSLGTALSTVADVGSGPNPRQAAPHPHHITLAPGGRFALVTDFGADRVFSYDFDRKTGALSFDPTTGRRSYALPAGSGPRRLLFGPDGRTAYLLSELSADLQVLEWNSRTGSLTLRQTISTDSPDHTGTRSAAELALSRDGRFVYASNRGENSLVVYAVDRRTGQLTLVQRLPCGGNVPWSFSLHRSGRWLLVANEASNTVDVFQVASTTGKLTATSVSVPITNPDCLTFVYR